MRDTPGFTAAKRLTVGDETVLVLTDGVFRVPPSFFPNPEALAFLPPPVDGGMPELPIGTFLVPGDAPMLIDAGIGPVDFGGFGTLIGGRLLDEIHQAGYQPDQIATVALTHLHPDHVGWLADTDGRPTFPSAKVVVSRRDWDAFLGGSEPSLTVEPHIKAALETLFAAGRVDLLDGESALTSAVTAIPAPGHTPGHQLFAVQDGPEKLLLLGDATYCPAQLSNVEWDVLSDFDPASARITRSRIAEQIQGGHTAAVGCHYPHFEPTRAVAL